MRYAKLVNHYPVYAPRRICMDGEWIYNPTEEMLERCGYLPLIESDPPETDGDHMLVSSWDECDGHIVQMWSVESD